MAGHSKWANIKHRKQNVDAKRSKEFQKIAREIKNAASYGKDPRKNPQLRLALSKARSVNMPKSVINRCLQSLDKDLQNDHFFWLGGQFAKKGVVLIQINHQNKISATNEIKKIVQKSRLELLSINSLKHFFNDLIAIEIEKITEENFLELLDQFDIFESFFAETKTILYFKDKQVAKNFRLFLKESNYQFIASFQTYLPLQEVILDDEAVKKYLILKTKLLEYSNCVQVVSNIVNKNKNEILQ